LKLTLLFIEKKTVTAGEYAVASWDESVTAWVVRGIGGTLRDIVGCP